MSKTAELIRLITVLILAMLIAGVAGFFIPRIEQVVSGEKISWQVMPEQVFNPTKMMYPAQQGQQDDERLQQKVTELIEQITGPGTVRASVRTEDVGAPFQNNGKRMAISVLIDGQTVKGGKDGMLYQPRSHADMEKYKTLIKAAVGFNEARGDTLAVMNLPFADHASVGQKGHYFALCLQGVWLALLLGIVLWLGCAFVIPMMQHLVCSDLSQTQRGASVRHPLTEAATHVCRNEPDKVARLFRNWLGQPPVRGQDYSGAGQAAIVALSVGEAAMSPVLKQMSGEDVCRLGHAMRTLGAVNGKDIKASLERFMQAAEVPDYVAGSDDQTKQFLTRALSQEEGERICSTLRMTAGGQTVWTRLEKLERGNLLLLIEKQEPETAALILYHLSDKTASYVLEMMSKEEAARVMIHLVHLRQIRSAVREKLEQDLAVRLSAFLKCANTPSGAEKASTIMRQMSKEGQAGLMTNLSQTDADALKRLSLYLMDFNQLAAWPDAALKQLLHYIDKDVAVIALAGAPVAVQAAFARNMSPALWEQIKNDMQALSSELRERRAAAEAIILKTAREVVRLNQKDVKA